MLEAIAVLHDSLVTYIILVGVEYIEGEPETYVLPLTFTSGEQAAQVWGEFPHAVVAHLRIKGKDEEGILYDALWDKGFSMVLLEAIAHHRQFKGVAGKLIASPTRAFRRVRGPVGISVEPSIMKAEQSNTSVVYGDRFILKLFRRLEAGINPDLEIGRFLTERASFTHIPSVTGALEYQRGRSEPMSLAILQSFVPNQGDAWQYTLDALGRYFERVLAHPEVQAPPLPQKPLLDLIKENLPSPAHEMIGTYLEAARLLGQRTAELHIALASDPDDPNFASEPFSVLYQRSIYQSMRSLTNQVFQLLRKRLKNLPEAVRKEAREVLNLEREVFKRFQSVLGRKLTAMRIRCHGDYHLGQVLYTGNDFIIIDFEGEPARALSERKLKRSPITDVAGMTRSFHYAAYTSLLKQASIRPEDISRLEPWADLWYRYVAGVFLKSYFDTAENTPFIPIIPRDRGELDIILRAFLLEKAIYELGYELNNRPDWVIIPVKGIKHLLEDS